MNKPLNRIAVLTNRYGNPAHWEYPVEQGLHDTRPNYAHGGKYGNGGFTGERCMMWDDGIPRFFRMDDHDRRFEASVAAYRYLELPCSRELRDEARFTLAAMNYGDNYVSLVFESQGDVGVYPKQHVPRLYANSRDMDPVRKPYLPVEAMQRGLRVMICNPQEAHRRYPTPLTLAKTSGNYGDSNVAKHLAVQAGFDDAILMDWTLNRISEMSVSNLILVEEGQLVTPFQDSAPLNGITKQTISTLCEERYSLPMLDKPISIDRLRAKVRVTGGSQSHVRAIMAVGTAVGIAKVGSITDWDGQLIWQADDPEADRWVSDISALYWRLLRGQEPGYHDDWFTPVPMHLIERYVPTDVLRKVHA